jgi:hypothetical protein
MSALPPKADIGTQSRDVRFVPKADILRAVQRLMLFDQLIGAGKYCLGMVMQFGHMQAGAIGKTLLRSKRIPGGTVGELQVAEIGPKSQTDA